MTDKQASKADELLAEYISRVKAGRSADVDSFIERCPPHERDDFRSATESYEFLRRHYEPFLVSRSLVERTRSAILARKDRQHRSAIARGRIEQTRVAGLLTAGHVLELLRSAFDLTDGPPSAQRVQSAAVLQFRGGPSAVLPAAAKSRAARELAQLGASREALQSWRLLGSPPPPVDPRALADALGLLLLEEETEGFDGCVLMQGEAAAIVLNSRVRNEGRKRFTLAHEIGHFQLHSRQVSFLSEAVADIECAWIDERELGANVFASEFLMPTELVTAEFAHQEPSFEAIDALAQRYCVSTTAAGRRLVDTSDFACALLCTIQGQVKWFASSSEFPYRLFDLVGSAPPPNSDLASLLSGQEPRDEPWETPVGWWTDDSRVSDEATLLEHSRRMYDDYIITVLYAKDVTA